MLSPASTFKPERKTHWQELDLPRCLTQWHHGLPETGRRVMHVERKIKVKCECGERMGGAVPKSIGNRNHPFTPRRPRAILRTNGCRRLAAASRFVRGIQRFGSRRTRKARGERQLYNIFINLIALVNWSIFLRKRCNYQMNI